MKAILITTNTANRGREKDVEKERERDGYQREHSMQA